MVDEGNNLNMDFKKLGVLGEDIVCLYLKNKSYKILERNYSKSISAVEKGEIDIIGKKDDIICFIEVKTSIGAGNTRADFSPEERVNYKKQRQIIKLAQMWLLEKKFSLNSKWQIDVISVVINLNSKKAKIRHFKNVFFQ
jgi:putative endonuclease